RLEKAVEKTMVGWAASAGRHDETVQPSRGPDCSRSGHRSLQQRRSPDTWCRDADRILIGDTKHPADASKDRGANGTKAKREETGGARRAAHCGRLEERPSTRPN